MDGVNMLKLRLVVYNFLYAKDFPTYALRACSVSELPRKLYDSRIDLLWDGTAVLETALDTRDLLRLFLR
jgi:hypothetical protein